MSDRKAKYNFADHYIKRDFANDDVIHDYCQEYFERGYVMYNTKYFTGNDNREYLILQFRKPL